MYSLTEFITKQSFQDMDKQCQDFMIMSMYNYHLCNTIKYIVVTELDMNLSRKHIFQPLWIWNSNKVTETDIKI